MTFWFSRFGAEDQTDLPSTACLVTLLLLDPSCLWANTQNIFAKQEEEEGAVHPIWAVSAQF